MSAQKEDEIMFVTTRTGRKENLDPNQITVRIQNLVEKEPRINHINPFKLMLEVCKGLKSGISTFEIDEYTANTCASIAISNPYYLAFAGRLAIDNHQKATDFSFLEKMKKAHENLDTEDKSSFPLLNDTFIQFVEKNQQALESMIDYSRDFLLDFFGIRNFQKSYSIKVDEKPIERPQDMFLREAICVSNYDLVSIKETYDLLSNKYYTHASPTCYNAGGVREQLASCFLLGTEDSIEGIEKTGTNAGYISKWAGGIGIHIHCWRSTGSKIRGTNGRSNGIVPFLRTYETRMCAYNQGGRRPGSAKIYLSPHHPDILKFLDLRSNDGIEKERARDLFYGIWCPDIFMERVIAGETWSLFNPHKFDLSNLLDKEYTEKYLELEREKKYTEQIPAREIWKKIHKSKKETGVPTICFSDTVNRYSMQRNIGVIKSSNLCSEIMLYSDSEEYATCVLASIGLAMFVLDSDPNGNFDFPKSPYFDFRRLLDVVKVITRNLNTVVDKTFSPVIEAKRGNQRHRPIGIGVQGLDDAYAKMRFPFDSKEASDLNKKIFETIYYGALTESTKMCRKEYHKLRTECKASGKVEVQTFVPEHYDPVIKVYTNPDEIPKRVASYSSIDWNGGSPIGKGVFHWEMYGVKKEDLSGMFDWESLREHILQFGVKNSLLVALMPTASTSQLLGNNECFEPYTSNIYTRDTLAGQYVVIKKYLINDLYNLGIWNDSLKDYLIIAEGSIQNIEGVPEEIKNLYKTAYEIDQNVLVQQAIDRQPFVDQAQSLNLYVHNLSLTMFTKLMSKAWRNKLKTGNYYMHTSPAVMPIKFTIDPKKQKEMAEMIEKNKQKNVMVKPGLVNICDSCGS